MRIFDYNWRLAWVVVPAFIWGWLGLTVVTGAMLRADGPAGPPPLGLKLERGLQGLHIPGILRAVREDEEGLVLVMELPRGAREVLEQRRQGGNDAKVQRPGGPGPDDGELIPGLGQLLGDEPQRPPPGGPADRQYDGPGDEGGAQRPVIIPDMPRLPEGVSIEIVEPGELERGRPQLELLEGSRVIELPRGDKLIVGQRWAVRIGREGARLLKKPAGGTEKLRRWLRRMKQDEGARGPQGPPRGPGGDGRRGPEGAGPRGPDERRERREQRRDDFNERRDRRRGQDTPPPGREAAPPPEPGR